MEEKVKELLNDLKPYINQDGGNIEFIKIEDNYVYIRLTGACQNCYNLDNTLNLGIETYLKREIPEIEGVINVEL